MRPELRAAIAQLGAGEYKDGSSTKAGWLYQPMGDFFPELQDVPVHTAAAVRHTFGIIQAAGGHQGCLLDLGCSTGYYLAGLGSYESRYGQEADSAAVAVAQALGLRVHLAAGRPPWWSYEPKPVTVLALNVHMWWRKQGVADEMMGGIAAIADRLFFQTAGMQSKGRFLVPEFNSIDDEREYLSRWFNQVEHLNMTSLHGGVRHLWVAREPKR